MVGAYCTESREDEDCLFTVCASSMSVLFELDQVLGIADFCNFRLAMSITTSIALTRFSAKATQRTWIFWSCLS